MGNRLTSSDQSSVTSYQYDHANRLTSVNDDVNYDWDGNGNLRNDGVNTYHYDAANRLIAISNQQSAMSCRYNGLGDRLQEIVNGQTTNFTMDLNAGLTQALSDGTNSYIYGIDRIAQVNGTNTEYFLGDALGSVRQLTNASGAITYASAYDPYGVTTHTNGASQTAYGFTGEYTDSYVKLIYLRSRWYDPASGRFNTRDSWQGDYSRPLSLNRWMYVEGNPINYTDPSGLSASKGGIDDLPVVLLDPRSLGYFAGQNVDLLPYLFYLNPNDFSFTSSIRYNMNNALAERAISALANKFSTIIGQGQIPNEPGDENYPTKFIVEALGGVTFWQRLIDVHGSTQNLFSAWFVVNNVNGRNMVAETFPLNPLHNFDSMRATVYLRPITQGNNKRMILDSDYMRLSFRYVYNTNLNFGGFSVCYPVPMTFISGLISTDAYYTVRFTTGQTSYRGVETRGEVRLLNSPDPAGVITLRGRFIGPEWKLHVLDRKIAK